MISPSRAFARAASAMGSVAGLALAAFIALPAQAQDVHRQPPETGSPRPVAFDCAVDAKPQHTMFYLVNAFDISPSVDPMEYRRMIEGMAYALVQPELIAQVEAIGGIAVSNVSFSSSNDAKPLTPTYIIANAEDAKRAADSLSRHSSLPPVDFSRMTDTGLGLRAAWGMAEACKGLQAGFIRINIITDAKQNAGPPAWLSRDAVLRSMDNAAINALYVSSNPDPFKKLNIDFLNQDVIGGSWSFVEIAHENGDFGEAMLKKFLLDIARGPSTMTARHAPG